MTLGREPLAGTEAGVIFERVLAATREGQRVALPTSVEGLEEAAQEALLESGVSAVSASREYPKANLADLREWVRRVVDPFRPNAVFLDTTTLISAYLLLTRPQRSLYAFHLWDLSTLVNAVVFFDHVFCCRNPDQAEVVPAGKLNRLLGDDVIVELPVAENDSASATMESLWYETVRFLESVEEDRHGILAGERTSYCEAWGRFLGVPADWVHVVDRHAAAVRYPSQGRKLVEHLLETLHEHEALEMQRTSFSGAWIWGDIVSECNLREEFNTRLAYALGLPYLPNSFRAPGRRRRYERARRLPTLLRSVRELDRIYAEHAGSYSDSRERTILLPVLLAALVSKIDTLDQFWEALAVLRRDARQLRARRADLDRACAEGNLEEIRRLEKAIKGEAEKPVLNAFTLGALGAAEVALTAVEPALGAAALVVQLAAAAFLPGLEKGLPKGLETACGKLFRPRSWFLMDVGSAAREITRARSKIEGLWGARVDEQFGVRQFLELRSWGLT